jgi:hypothetical protein
VRRSSAGAWAGTSAAAASRGEARESFASTSSTNILPVEALRVCANSDGKAEKNVAILKSRLRDIARQADEMR